MDSDIVTRIRQTAAEGFSVTDWTQLSFDMQEAADEIDKWRTIAAKLWEDVMLSADDQALVKAEVERLYPND